MTKTVQNNTFTSSPLTPCNDVITWKNYSQSKYNLCTRTLKVCNNRASLLSVPCMAARHHSQLTIAAQNHSQLARTDRHYSRYHAWPRVTTHSLQLPLIITHGVHRPTHDYSQRARTARFHSHNDVLASNHRSQCAFTAQQQHRVTVWMNTLRLIPFLWLRTVLGSLSPGATAPPAPAAAAGAVPAPPAPAPATA